jgi:enoyl-CoA hydratase
MPQDILCETLEAVGVVRINRPEALNALNPALLEQIVAALERYDADAGIRCMLLAGSERAFSSGYDLSELSATAPIDVYRNNLFARWERLRAIRKPIVAAVSGYAVSAGCELMLAADIVIASETARIGLPDTGVGAIPGAGGTQRLTRVAGKALAMDMILTGRTLSADEALQAGLVSRVVPRENYLSEAMHVCHELSKRAPLALQLAKRAVLSAYDSTLAAGLAHEHDLFQIVVGTADYREGLRASLEKRPAVFAGR